MHDETALCPPVPTAEEENAEKAPFWIKEKSVVCCIDLEAHCYNQSWTEYKAGIRLKDRRVCEVGMAFADGRVLDWSQRGDRWATAFEAIQQSSDDFAIIENEHTGPHTKVWKCYQSRPEWFLYGTPKWVHLDDIRDQVIGRIKEVIGDNHRSSQAEPSRNETRVVFAFYDTNNDLKWLHGLGIHLEREFPNSCIVDIQRDTVARAIARYREWGQIGAVRFLEHLGLDAPGHHNGGNDAVHELQGYLASLALTKDQFEKVTRGESLPRLGEEEEEVQEEAADKGKSTAILTPPAAVQEEPIVFVAQEGKNAPVIPQEDSSMRPPPKQDPTKMIQPALPLVPFPYRWVPRQPAQLPLPQPQPQPPPTPPTTPPQQQETQVSAPPQTIAPTTPTFAPPPGQPSGNNNRNRNRNR